MPDMEQVKKQLRQKMRTLRHHHSRTQKDFADQALDSVAQLFLKHAPQSGVLASYHATGTEISPHSIEEVWRQQGLPVALPRIVTPGQPLSFHLYTPGEPLISGPHGIQEPSPEAELALPAIVLVPLLAVDRHGRRLGQGGGYYDRTLVQLRRSNPILAIGLAYDVQLLDFVPASAHDQNLDAVLTPSQWIDCHTNHPLA